ncbi:hypothetical protein RN51_02086 [Microbacterium oxydans]|uniref:IgA FC receptor n=1 Tax=Microbacterium oxydans TaxID=82380 RepID=A0A0F0KSL3_9MICO|nr:hypothetical protein [Microbacterium oxydans]KJL22206.1 hypothetical protein RN51_02086 [Microbacterium oxydans]
MSEPQQPSGPPAPHLPAAPQYPAAPHPGGQTAAAPGPTTPAYVAPTYPAPPYPPHPVDTGNPLGRVAFLIAVIAFAVNLVVSLTAPFAYFAADGYGWYSVISGLVAAVSLVGYVLAFILGLVAVRRPAPHLLAGIAIGIAGVGAIGMVTTWASSLFYRFF